MRTIVFSVLVICFGLRTLGQTELAFVRTYGGDYYEDINEIISCNNGGYAFVGTTSSSQFNSMDIYVVRLADDLSCIWNQSIGTGAIEQGLSIDEDSSGNLIVCGFTNSNAESGYDAIVTKLDEMGQLIWQKTFGGSDWDFARCIRAKDNGGFFFCGNSYSFSGAGSIGWIVELNDDGDLVQERTVSGQDECSLQTLNIYNDTTLVFGGHIGDTNGVSHPWLLCVDEETQIYWQDSFPNYFHGSLKSVIPSIDGNLIAIADYMTEQSDENTVILKYTIGGEEIFLREFDNFSGNDVAENSNYIYVSGVTSSFGSGGTGAYFSRHNNEGYWATGSSFGGELSEAANSLTIDTNGNILFGGFSNSLNSSNTMDGYLVKFVNPVTVSDYQLDIEHLDCFTLEQIEIQDLPIPNVFVDDQKSLRSHNNIEYLDLRIYDLMGRLIFSKIIHDDTLHEDLSTFCAGFYVVHCSYGDTHSNSQVIDLH